MDASARVVMGWVLCVLSLLLTGFGIVLTVADGRSPAAGMLGLGSVLAVSTGLLGAFIVTRFPGNPIGWLFLAGAITRALSVAAQAWCVRALVTAPGSLPGGVFASWLQAWVWLPSIATAPMIVVLFPDGRLPGRIWRVVPVMAGVGLLLTLVAPVGMWRYRGPALLPEAPVPDTPDARVGDALISLGSAIALLSVVVALVAVVVRARRVTGVVRRQVLWFVYGAGCAVVITLVALLPGLAWVRPLSVVAVLVGIGLGIFRYRLYDVDRLINRTLVYGLVTAALGTVFAALVVTLALVAGRSSAVIAAASAFVVALLLRPVRDRAQDLVDRVFDRRAYDAVRTVRALAARIGHEPVPPRLVVDTLRRALRDPELVVHFPGPGPPLFVDGVGAAVDPRPPAAGRVTVPVRRNGQTIAVVVHDDTRPRLARQVLQAAVPVLEHARLQAELRVQLAEVRASRARLVAASDVERRRIERDLHDGAQQRLVGLALHLQSARRRDAYPTDVTELLVFTVEQLRAAVEDIRSLVHGILPPALAASGLPAALAELAHPGKVDVACDIPARLDPSVESTAWFVACEGVANATKHAPGHPAHVEVSTVDGQLTVRVRDDGPGGADPHGDGLRNLADRVEAHGGSLTIASGPGTGTTLVAELPCGS
ncbi:MAG TPA: histidine kinase [Actinophytocola sp.]|jgi:signal transduction histidine kinase|nr:histidine kinase [Actinophytocola sp.]